MVDFVDGELSGPLYSSIYKKRYEQYGPHPVCKGCIKQDLCMVANIPGYDFSCNEKVEGSTKLAAQVKKRNRKGGWGEGKWQTDIQATDGDRPLPPKKEEEK